MRLNSIRYWQILFVCSILLGFATNVSKAEASGEISPIHSGSSFSNKFFHEALDANLKIAPLVRDRAIIAQLPVVPEAVILVKNFEGFRSRAYIDSSGLPVIGYGQTRVNGKVVTMGQYITPSQADAALERELDHIQQLILSHVKVDLNPYQLGALTSLVYNAGAVIVKNSTLVRKLNAGDYAGAAREFPRWNKANLRGKLVVYPGLTKRRVAEQKLFLTTYDQIVSNR